MRVFHRRAGIAALTLGLAVGMFGIASPAQAVDDQPCGSQFYQKSMKENVQYCPDWAPNNQIPVFNGPNDFSGIAGYIYAPGDDWYACQKQGFGYTLGQFQNDWWARTMADNGKIGWVNEVYFKGGGNLEADQKLRPCAPLIS